MEERFKQLDELPKRTECPKCSKKRFYFCYDCHVYMTDVLSIVPYVELPFQIAIIKHPGELNGKSTAIHCKLIAPDETAMYDRDDTDIPRYNEERNTVLVYPDHDALSIEEFTKKNGPIQRLVFLDATWNGINSLKKVSQIQGLPTVSLKSYKTEYWRPQRGCTDEHLATIEAIFYAIKETWQAQNPGKEYDGKFDDLLFWFRFFKHKFINSKDK